MSKLEMSWDDKTKMIQHFNNSEWVEGTNLVVENIENLDEQAVDMFFTAISLLKSDLILAKENHIVIYQKLKTRKLESWRTAIRMGVYEMQMEEIISES